MAISSDQQFFQNSDDVFEPSVADFWLLLKPRVMSLVIFTGFAGMYVAPGSLHPLVFIVSLFAIAAGAAAVLGARYRTCDAQTQRINGIWQKGSAHDSGELRALPTELVAAPASRGLVC